MNVRDSLPRLVADLLFGCPIRRQRQRVSELLELEAKHNAEVTRYHQLTTHYQEQADAIDHRREWHAYAETMDKVAENCRLLARASDRLLEVKAMRLEAARDLAHMVDAVV